MARVCLLLTVLLLVCTAATQGQIPPVEGTPVTAATFRYLDVRIGEGPIALPGQRYTVHYTGWLPDGKKFDSSRDRNQPLDFVQGRRHVIAGWEAGFEGMRVGGQRRLFIPYQMAYGEAGRGPIPPRAELIFDVELLSVSEAPALADAVDLIEPLKSARSKLLTLAKAVPDDKYMWSPSAGTRTFAQVMQHVALGNALIFDIATKGLSGDALKSRIDANSKMEGAPLGKQEVIVMLGASFEPVLHYLESARNGSLGNDLTFFGTPLTRRGVLVFLNTHAAEHLGQAVAYARMMGVQPPWSR